MTASDKEYWKTFFTLCTLAFLCLLLPLCCNHQTRESVAAEMSAGGWELVSGSYTGDVFVDKIAVPGGYIYRTVHRTGFGAGVGTSFIPNIDSSNDSIMYKQNRLEEQ